MVQSQVKAEQAKDRERKKASRAAINQSQLIAPKGKNKERMKASTPEKRRTQQRLINSKEHSTVTTYFCQPNNLYKCKIHQND